MERGFHLPGPDHSAARQSSSLVRPSCQSGIATSQQSVEVLWSPPHGTDRFGISPLGGSLSCPRSSLPQRLPGILSSWTTAAHQLCLRSLGGHWRYPSCPSSWFGTRGCRCRRAYGAVTCPIHERFLSTPLRAVRALLSVGHSVRVASKPCHHLRLPWQPVRRWASTGQFNTAVRRRHWGAAPSTGPF
jgi:hypothetical protein